VCWQDTFAAPVKKTSLILHPIAPLQAAGMAAVALFVAASVPLCGAFSPMHLRHGVLHRSAHGSAASPHRPCEHGRMAGVALAAKQQSAADEAAQAAIDVYSGAYTEDEDQAAVKRLEFDMVRPPNAPSAKVARQLPRLFSAERS